ncbi:MAG: ABC transporter ATP-binding protein [Anaerolineaceae bacterium]|nr:ABC transporter ATP-binding protein [Anaerolineaceae bacterium]
MKSIWRLLKLSHSQGLGMTGWLLFSALVSGLSPMVNIIMPKYILDELLRARRLEMLASYVVILGLGNLLFSVLKALCKRNLGFRGYKLYLQFNEMLSAKSLRLSLSESEKKSIIDLLERGKFGLYGLFDISTILQNLGAALVSATSIIFLLLVQDWFLLLIVAGIGLLTLPSFKKIHNLDLEDARRSVVENRQFNYFCFIATDFRYAKDLRLYHGSELMLGRAKKVMDRILKINHDYFTKSGFWSGVSAGLVELQNVAIFIRLGLKLLKNVISVGAFSMLYAASQQLARAMNQLISNGIQLSTISFSLDPFFAFLALPEDKAVDSAPMTESVKECLAKVAEGQLEWEVCDLNFKYPTSDTWSVKHCNLHICSGENVALVGKNGAGKTSLVKLLCRIYKPQSGRILLNGVDIWDIPLEAYYRVLAPTFQDFQLLPLTIEENISSQPGAKLDRQEQSEIQGVLKKVAIWDWVETLPQKLKTFLSRSLHENGVLPSGGQAQKIALARSLYHRGKFLIMDEPTAALDPRSEEEVFQKMLELTHHQTALFISHRLSSTRYADRILVMDSGKIIEEGSHPSLISKGGLYSQMYKIQSSQYFEEPNQQDSEAPAVS